MRRAIKSVVTIAACLAAVAAGGCSQGSAKAKREPAARGGCDRRATPATFARQVEAASDGQTICLGAGNYGNWTGTAKSITVRPQPGVSPTMTFDFGSSAANFTLDGGHTGLRSSTPGINITGASFLDPGSRNITAENLSFTTSGSPFFLLDIRTDGPGILVRGNIFHDLEYPNQTTGAIRILPNDKVPASNIQVNYNLFRDMGADGIDGGPGTIVGNEFSNVSSQRTPQDPRHTDVIQIGGSANGGDVIEGSFVHNGCGQGIDAFDGTSSNVIKDNVIVGCAVHSLVLAGDTPASTVDHNTVVGAPDSSLLECGSKPEEGPSVTEIQDNILQDGVGSSGVPCQPSQNSHNMFFPGATLTAFAGSGNFIGVAKFVGGASPASYADYALAPGSPGTSDATDGSNVGARVNRYPRP